MDFLQKSPNNKNPNISTKSNTADNEAPASNHEAIHSHQPPHRTAATIPWSAPLC